MSSASARRCRIVPKAASISRSMVAENTSRRNPSASAAARRFLVFESALRLAGLTRTPIVTALGTSSCSSSSRFGQSSPSKEATPVRLPSGRFETSDETERYRIDADSEDDRDGRSGRLGRECRGDGGGKDHGYAARDKIGSQRRQPIVFAV